MSPIGELYKIINNIPLMNMKYEELLYFKIRAQGQISDEEQTYDNCLTDEESRISLFYAGI